MSKNQCIFTVWFAGISKKGRESLGSNIFLKKITYTLTQNMKKTVQ